MKLTESNYYSQEADKEYFSVSQYKSFMVCEKSAMAQINGLYEYPKSKDMLIGSYVDSWFEGTLEKFKEENPEIFTKQGKLRAEFVKAEEIIEILNNDERFMQFMSGDKQSIFTFDMFGTKWKMKMDSYIKDTCITDLKVMSRFENLWKFRYDIQGAIYQAGVEKNGGGKLPFYLAAVTKEKIPDRDIFQVSQAQLDLALKEVEENIGRYIAIKKGEEDPIGCGQCDYCKMIKKANIRDFAELINIQ